jgi:DNA-binding transcriptional ArsR family regulator
MRDFMALTKALADENRVRLLLALNKKELCLCQLAELVRLRPSTVSTHMSILKRAGLVAGRKNGRWMYYRLPGDGAPAVVRQALEWVSGALHRNHRVVEDRDRLKAIVAVDPTVLCERQLRSPAAC